MLKWVALGIGVLLIASRNAVAGEIDPNYVNSLPRNANGATELDAANRRINTATPTASTRDVPTEYINNLPMDRPVAAGSPPSMQPNPGPASTQTFTSGPFAGKTIDLSRLGGGAGSFNMSPEQLAKWKAQNAYTAPTVVGASGGGKGTILQPTAPLVH
jgi:hypothetical protein